MAYDNPGIPMFAGDYTKIMDTIQDANNNLLPFNLSGCTVDFVLFRPNDLTNPLMTKNLSSGVAIEDAPNGIVSVTLAPADTTNLAVGSYPYRVHVTKAGNQVTVSTGTIAIMK